MSEEQFHSSGIVFFDIALARSENPVQHWHDFHEFFFNYESGGEQLSGARRQAMRPGDLYFFPAGQSHIGNGECHGGVLYVGVEALSPFVPGEDEALAVLRLLEKQARQGRNLLPLSSGGRETVGALFGGLLDEFRCGDSGAGLSWRIMAMRLLLVVLRELTPAQQTGLALPRLNAEERIRHVCRYLRENCVRDIDVDMAARTAGMSRSHFLGRFRRVTGVTFTEYLNRYRCERAAVLLRQGDVAPAEAARACGFKSVSNFYRAFRTLTGRRPGDFRSEPEMK